MERAGLLAQEPRQVPRDRGVRGIGQPDLRQPGPSPPRGQVARRRTPAGTHRAAPCPASRESSSVLIEPPITFDPRPSTFTTAAVLLRLREKRLLGPPARVEQRDSLGGVEALHAFRQRAGDRIRQRQVHVVSAQQDVLADGQPRENQVAPFILHRDQREVGRSAANVAHQDVVARLHLLAPLLALACAARRKTQPAALRATSHS